MTDSDPGSILRGAQGLSVAILLPLIVGLWIYSSEYSDEREEVVAAARDAKTVPDRLLLSKSDWIKAVEEGKNLRVEQ